MRNLVMLKQFLLGTSHEDQQGNGCTAAAIVIAATLIAVLVIGGFLLWLYTEPTWWEDLIGKTRWDKIMEFFNNLLGK